jgi:hypothetical protein
VSVTHVASIASRKMEVAKKGNGEIEVKYENIGMIGTGCKVESRARISFDYPPPGVGELGIIFSVISDTRHLQIMRLRCI